jgi:hypothetical protein
MMRLHESAQRDGFQHPNLRKKRLPNQGIQGEKKDFQILEVGEWEAVRVDRVI